MEWWAQERYTSTPKLHNSVFEDFYGYDSLRCIHKRGS
jgi:hypothetical protein